MKLLHIHPTEDLTSIIDRLEKEQSPEIILEIPPGAQIFRSIVNFKILKRWVESLNKLITISTEDETGKFLAQKVGFSTTFQKAKFKNMTQKPKDTKPIKMADIIRRKRPGKRKIFRKKVSTKRPKVATAEPVRPEFPRVALKPKRRFNSTLHKKILLSAISSKSIFAFFLVSVLAAGFVLFLVLPRAKIEITAKTEPLSLDLEVIADTNLDIEDILTQKIPAKILSATSGDSKQFPATDRILLQQKARGVITIYNEWSSQTQTLIKTTRLLSEEGKLFRTLKTVVVPGAEIVGGQRRAGTIDVEVEAADIGEDYNIGASSFKIPAFKEYNQLEKYASIYGKSESPMTGGANREELVVSKEDLERGKRELVQELSEGATSRFYGQLPQGYKVVEDASHLEEKNVTSSHKVGEVAKDFTLEAEVSLEAIVFSQEVLESFINSLVCSKIPEGRTPINETQKITYSKAKPDFEKGQLKLNIHVEQSLIYEIDTEALKEDLAGKDKSQVREILLTYATIERAQVSLWPFWVKKVPSSSRRINIILTR